MKPLKKEEIVMPGWYWMFGAAGRDRNNYPDGVVFLDNNIEIHSAFFINNIRDHSYYPLSYLVPEVRFYGPLESPE